VRATRSRANGKPNGASNALEASSESVSVVGTSHNISLWATRVNLNNQLLF
jgi:hypothetical protein